jgi:hypothetical protein
VLIVRLCDGREQIADLIERNFTVIERQVRIHGNGVVLAFEEPSRMRLVHRSGVLG